MKAKSTFLARKALASPTLVQGRLRGRRSGLPNAYPKRQNQPQHKPVIRRISVKNESSRFSPERIEKGGMKRGKTGVR